MYCLQTQGHLNNTKNGTKNRKDYAQNHLIASSCEHHHVEKFDPAEFRGTMAVMRSRCVKGNSYPSLN